jgi:hypothetical protein
VTGHDDEQRDEIASVELVLTPITSEQQAEWVRTARDKQQRLTPAPDAVRLAVLLLEAEPRASWAFVPMVLPGMTPGLWTLEQPVVTVPGVVMLARGGVAARGLVTPTPVPDAMWVRDQVMRLAREYLRKHHDGNGVAAVAGIGVTGHADVQEDDAVPELRAQTSR